MEQRGNTVTKLPETGNYLGTLLSGCFKAVKNAKFGTVCFRGVLWQELKGKKMSKASGLWVHKKTGGFYTVLFNATNEADLVETVVYKALKDGSI